MATHARIFYYEQRIGTSIDFSAYKAWLDTHPEHNPPDILPDEHRPAASSPSTLSWQEAAPKAPLFVDKTSQAAETASGPAGAGEPSYPMAFAEMIRLLQEGKPVPGVREIPNTIARQPVRKPLDRKRCISMMKLTMPTEHKTCQRTSCPKKAVGESNSR